MTAVTDMCERRLAKQVGESIASEVLAGELEDEHVFLDPDEARQWWEEVYSELRDLDLESVEHVADFLATRFRRHCGEMDVHELEACSLAFVAAITTGASE